MSGGMSDAQREFEQTFLGGQREWLPKSDAARALLRGVGEAPAEPIDRLLDHLSRGRSATALLDAHGGTGWRGLLDAATEIEALDAAKREAKRRFAAPGLDDADADAALLTYLLAVAAGLAHHRQNLSSLSADTLIDWLGALRDAVGAGELRALLSGAIKALD